MLTKSRQKDESEIYPKTATTPLTHMNYINAESIENPRGGKEVRRRGRGDVVKIVSC